MSPYNETSPGFALQPKPDATRLGPTTRLVIEWDGSTWAEIDPKNGDVLAVGVAPEEATQWE